MPIPSRIAERLSTQLKRFQPILASARDRDVGEADTSTIVKDILSDLFGYDKYSEITAEFQIKGTYCDLALKIDGKLVVLIEVKAIGTDLKEPHTKQAVDYAANQGVEWVFLTNGLVWKVYRVIFAQPISQELVVEINLMDLSGRNEGHLDMLHMLTREAHSKDALDDYHAQRQAMSRFFLGAMLMSDPVIDTMRRELKKVSPGVRFENEEIRQALIHEVVKREVMEGDKATDARRKIARALAKAAAPKSKPAAPAGQVENNEPPAEP
ncbi:MAG: type I restriction enzyme HsdR N-terminal domain-containing protein [Verrucomicrobiaceae bacterium]|nr:type I restriction enzyme HsdR N-terminal domain-containing protein [Verrucomicrobiaceae bacterium]